MRGQTVLLSPARDSGCSHIHSGRNLEKGIDNLINLTDFCCQEGEVWPLELAVPGWSGADGRGTKWNHHRVIVSV